MTLVLPEVRLSREAPPYGARPFKWADADIGYRSKIGGAPDFMQSERTPQCTCGADMSFYGQLDSLNDDFNIGDCGMIYVFLCFDCLESKAVTQCG